MSPAAAACSPPSARGPCAPAARPAPRHRGAAGRSPPPPARSTRCKHLAPVVSLSVVYLPAVLLVSAYWGLRARARHLAAERRGLQLLPPPADRPLHDRRQPQLGRAGGVHRSSPWRSARSPSWPAAGRGRPSARRAEADLAAALARELLGRRGDRRARSPRPPAGSPRRSGCARRRSSSAPPRATSGGGRFALRDADGSADRHAARPARPAGGRPSSGCARTSCRRSRRSWRSRCAATRSRPRRSRRRRCGAATTSRPRCCARSRTTCARR